MTKKFTLAMLSPKPHKLNLVHPIAGEIDAYVEIVGQQSKEFIEAGTKVGKEYGDKDISTLDAQEIMEYTAKVYAFLVQSWDNDFFGCEPSQANIIKVFSNVENQWIVTQIKDALEDNTLFFDKSVMAA